MGLGSAKDEARKVYDAFRKVGGNFIDTANFYANGTSESFLGEFMMDHRQSVVLATKYSNAVPDIDQNALPYRLDLRQECSNTSRLMFYRPTRHLA
jgi:aryl-alcohol dehydrogenase-like predicted oxidoreductase